MKMKRVSVLALAFAATLAGAGAAAAVPMIPSDPREAIAMAYLDALLTHDASNVPFAPDCTRVEAGIQTGYSGPQLTHDLDTGPQYQLVQRIYDVRLSDTGSVVTARYHLDSGIAGQRLVTVAITETFDIPDGSIHRIVADIVPISLS
ncbi:hypothetical protein KO481_30545 [Nocardia sp. NEAU-G5]|uniref:DUF8021 domain-containing protein n=1 Tax=Nocardia albiluteola TaxID=2842303 RepID=A0ABS6B9J4_9NOCA|nr:hypothetical protein [Nocardia albiluteola]MBU3065849.1 hypothetical protein [Nocardia albiluteola]